MSARSDRWSRWLLERRDGGSDSQRTATLERLVPIRDRVLEGAGPLDGLTLLDVGTGDGLVGLAALDRVGPSGTVIFSDISEALLSECRRAVDLQGRAACARFVLADAEHLSGVADSSVDVVTARSVLIYVADKTRAFASFRRVLRPGGRVSLFEPINRLMYPEPDGRFWGYELAAVTDLAVRVKARFDQSGDSPVAHEAMMGFDDRDLVDLAQHAGFDHVHLECHIDIEPGAEQPLTFQALLDGSPNPNVPTVREAVSEMLNDAEQTRFLGALARAYATQSPVRRHAVAYLVGRSPR